MSWRLARSLVQLRQEIDAAYPHRPKGSDGSISSARHRQQNPNSDHDPDRNGVVRAIDVTRNGDMAYTICEHIRLSRDRRVKYVIFNRQMFSSYAKGNHKPWTWRTYSGANPHSKHFHVSVVADTRADDRSTWGIANLPKDEDMSEIVKNIQLSLSAAGFDPGPADGVWGPRTEAAFVKALKGSSTPHTHTAQVKLS